MLLWQYGTGASVDDVLGFLRGQTRMAPSLKLS